MPDQVEMRPHVASARGGGLALRGLERCEWDRGRASAGLSRARRLRERIQADVPRPTVVRLAMAIPLPSALTITGRPIGWAATVIARAYMTRMSGSRRIT